MAHFLLGYSRVSNSAHIVINISRLYDPLSLCPFSILQQFSYVYGKARKYKNLCGCVRHNSGLYNLCSDSLINTYRKNKKVSTKKVMKNKQFTQKFELSEMNYVELLNAFLKIHHIHKYQATATHIFTFKIQVPPMKYRR